MHLQHLFISGFRGVGVGMDLPLAQRTIFYGPNGCGKTSILQSIAWTLYGKLPAFSGGVFSKEDALVNDFFDVEKAEVSITLSDNNSITRRRNKQDSTAKGTKPPLLSFHVLADPQDAIEKLLGLTSDEFFAAVFLHQETIREFLTTTPEKRSSTIDRMIGTSLLRSLIKQVDPKIPNKAIEAAQANINLISTTLSQASVLNREMIDSKKAQYGDPETLPHVLDIVLEMLSPILAELGLPVPNTSLDQINASLFSTRQTQLERVSALTKQAGELRNLQVRYHNAAETNWQNVRQQKKQFGDPTELPALLQNIREELKPICQKLALPQPGLSLVELGKSLETARQSQAATIGQLSQRVAALEALQVRFQQVAVTDWQGFNQRKSTLGDPAYLPTLLNEAQQSLVPILQLLGLPTPPIDLLLLEASLAKVRQALPGIAGKLERQAGEILALKENYLQASREVVDEISVPEKLTVHREELKRNFISLSKDISALARQRDDLLSKKEQAVQLRITLQSLPVVEEAIAGYKKELARMEAAGKQGKTYNQVLDASRQYFEQAHPEHCPVCKQKILDFDRLVEKLRSETPADVAQLRKEYDLLNQKFLQMQTRQQELNNQKNQLDSLEAEITSYPTDLEAQINFKQNQSDQATIEISSVQIEISQIEGRIQQATENSRRLEETVKKIETVLGKVAWTDLPAELDLAADEARRRAISMSMIDFQPLANQIGLAKNLFEMEVEGKRLSKQLDVVLIQVKNMLGSMSTDDIPGSFEKAITAFHSQIDEIEGLEFQQIATGIGSAKQLQLIQNEEDRLRQQLVAVDKEIRQMLKLSGEETDLNSALEGAIQEKQARADQVNGIDLQLIDVELNRAKRLDEILKDEVKLHDMENNYQTANREKARLTHQILRLTELRDALQDIAETTKRHQSTIVTEVLNNLDIHHYYRQLDPHPAYTDLQIEPELTEKGTYNYWIKALTEDYTHGTYVQTRFSTAQANCAAIAIFLAVNQHLSKTLETIILDDPSQSMDPDHKQRLAQTLASSSRQVIVATEDPQMYTYLKQSFITPTIYELTPWTVEGSRLIVEQNRG